MFQIKDATEYDITREGILARDGKRTKDALFSSVCTELLSRILSEIQACYSEIKYIYEVIHGGRPEGYDAHGEAVEVWDYGLLDMLKTATPEMYVHHLEATFPDLDMAALTIAGWAVKGLHHTYASRPGAFLARFGIVAADYADVAHAPVQEPQANGSDAEAPATRDDVASAWQQMTQALEIDQREQAKQLGVSRSTISNYGSGKTAGKCNSDQAAYLAAECRSRANALLAAAHVFERVK